MSDAEADTLPLSERYQRIVFLREIDSQKFIEELRTNRETKFPSSTSSSEEGKANRYARKKEWWYD